MTFVTVPDKSTGDVFTETMWDTHVKDNLNKGAWRPIAHSLLGADAASISFTGIATDYRHLMLVLQARNTSAVTATTVLVRLNNDSGSNYDNQSQYSAQTTVVGAEGFAQTFLLLGTIPGASATANMAGIYRAVFPNYVETTAHKNMNCEFFHKSASSTGNLRGGGRVAGFWRNTAAINRIDILAAANNLLAGSMATLYGSAAA